MAGAAVVLIGATVISALSLRAPLEQAKNDLMAAEASLSRPDLAAAIRGFERAQRTFEEAADNPATMILRVAGRIPFAGRTPDTLVELSTIGRDVTAAGAWVLRSIERLPGGLESLGPNHGRIPLHALSTIAPVVHRARGVLDRSMQRILALPEAWVVGPVSHAADEVRYRLADAVAAVRAADELLRVLPRLAGADGSPRTYFVAPQNLTEERGTGGVIGNYGLMTISKGVVQVGPFSNIATLPSVPPAAIEPPSAEYARLYDSFGGAGFWLNLNMTPDAPTAGQLIESLYAKVRGRRLDGTVFVDLIAMAEMLEATGPVRVPRLDATLTHLNLISFVAEARYLGAFPNAETVGPRLIAESILRRFFSSTPPEAGALALIRSAAGGHLMIHAREPQTQEAIRRADLAGRFGGSGSDFFSVVSSNAAGNKVDYYLQRTLRYDVELLPEGRAWVRAIMTFANRLPPDAEPSYSLGPYPGLDLVAGENQAWTSFYCSSRCRLVESIADGVPIRLGYYRELGLNRYSSFLRVKPAQTRRVELALDVANAWTGDHASGEYRLMLQGPPTIRSTSVEVTLSTPPGTEVTWTSEPMAVEGGHATWRGTLAGRHEFQFGFTQPLPNRMVTRVRDFLSRPVIRL